MLHRFSVGEYLHATSLWSFPMGSGCLVTVATDSLNTLRSLWHGGGLSPWLQYLQSFTMKVDKYKNGI